MSPQRICLLLLSPWLALTLPVWTEAPRSTPREQKGKPKPRTDRHGDPLPERAIARLGTVRWRSPGLLAYFPDGKTLASVGMTEALLLDARNGKVLRKFKWGFKARDSEWPRCVRVAGDGQVFVLTVADLFVDPDHPVLLRDGA